MFLHDRIGKDPVHDRTPVQNKVMVVRNYNILVPIKLSLQFTELLIRGSIW